MLAKQIPTGHLCANAFNPSATAVSPDDGWVPLSQNARSQHQTNTELTLLTDCAYSVVNSNHMGVCEMNQINTYEAVTCTGVHPDGLGRCYHGNRTTPVTRIARFMDGTWVAVCSVCWVSDSDWYEGRPDLGPASIPVAGPTWMTLHYNSTPGRPSEQTDTVSGWVWVDRYSDHVTVAFEPGGSHGHDVPEVPSEMATIPLDQLCGPPVFTRTYLVTVGVTGDRPIDVAALCDSIAEDNNHVVWCEATKVSDR